MNFRKATLSDVRLLRDFESKLVAYERTIEPGIIQKGPLEYYDIPKLLEDISSAIVFIAEIDGQPVGCGLGQIKENDSYNSETQYGYIGIMYVDEDQRGKNVGSSIVRELITWFHSKGINEIRLKVFAGNPIAISAYQKYGFAHYIHEMKLKKPD